MEGRFLPAIPEELVDGQGASRPLLRAVVGRFVDDLLILIEEKHAAGDDLVPEVLQPVPVADLEVDVQVQELDPLDRCGGEGGSEESLGDHEGDLDQLILDLALADQFAHTFFAPDPLALLGVSGGAEVGRRRFWPAFEAVEAPDGRLPRLARCEEHEHHECVAVAEAAFDHVSVESSDPVVHMQHVNQLPHHAHGHDGHILPDLPLGESIASMDLLASSVSRHQFRLLVSVRPPTRGRTGLGDILHTKIH